MTERSTIIYVHGIETGERLCQALMGRPGVLAAEPRDVVTNPDPTQPNRNEAVVVRYDSDMVVPTEIEAFIQELGYKPVAREEGPMADRA